MVMSAELVSGVTALPSLTLTESVADMPAGGTAALAAIVIFPVVELIAKAPELLPAVME